jgi:hypothetical protein
VSARQSARRWPRRVCTVGLLVLASVPIGTAWHEVVGHGLTAVALGGHIDAVVILGVQVWPALGWSGWDGHYGWCFHSGLDDARSEALVSLGGSLSTFCVAVVAVVLLNVRRWNPAARYVLGVLGIWWVDLVTYLAPAFGLRRSLLWGGRYSEPYEAAVELGLPGPLFIGLALASSIVLIRLLVRGLRLKRPTVGAPG